MSYQRETFELHSVAPDLIAQDAPLTAWNAAQNVFFRNGESVRAIGDKVTMTTSDTPVETCVFVRVGATPYWVYATNTGVFANNGSVNYDITPAEWTGNQDATFTSCVLNGVAYVNASDRAPVYWDGIPGNACVPLPDWPEGKTCLALRAHKNFLFAIGFDDTPGRQRVRWSDAAEAGAVPQSWTPEASNFAGFVDLAPLSSPCLEGVTLRDSFVVFKTQSIWSFDFVGIEGGVFAVRKLFAEAGIANTNAATIGIDDRLLFVAAEGDVMLTDGVSVQSILDGRAQRDFYATFTSNTAGRFAAAALARENLAFIIYPSEGQTYADKALVYDFVSGDIGFRDMPGVRCAAEGAALEEVGAINTWDGTPEAETWDTGGESWQYELRPASLDDVLIGGAFGFAVVSDGQAGDFVDGPVEASLSKMGLSFGSAQRRKMVSRIWPKVVGDEGDILTFRVLGQDVTGGPVTLGPPVTFTIGQDVSIDTFLQARFLGLEVRSSGGNPWRMGTVDVEFRELGGW